MRNSTYNRGLNVSKITRKIVAYKLRKQRLKIFNNKKISKLFR